MDRGAWRAIIVHGVTELDTTGYSPQVLLFNKLFKLCFFPSDCPGSSLLCPGFSLVVVSWGDSPVAVSGLLIAVASLVAEQGL